MGEPDDDLTPEERRLREYLEREETRGGWPVHLQREHPDLFPVHSRKRERDSRLPADPGAVRWLLRITVPIVALLLLLEVTDALIGSAWLLALLVAMAGMSFYFGFLYRHHILQYFRYSARAGFLALLFMIGLAGYFGVREERVVGELAALVDIIPEVTDTRYVPTAAELQAVEGILSAMSGSFDRAAALAVPEPDDSEQRYWLMTTALGVEEAVAFYEAEEHRRDWRLSDQDGGMFLLHRGGERLIIFVRDDWPRPRTLVSYIYSRTP